MTAPQAVGLATPAWAEVANAALITSAMADDALRAMELLPARFLDRQRPVAERIEQVAVEMNRVDLELRARLAVANVLIRQGFPIDGSDAVHRVREIAEQTGDAFALARSYFLLAWVAYSIGDSASAQINGIRGVELLPDDVPAGILMDHLTIVGIAYSPAPESQEYFDEVLRLAVSCRDPARFVAIHNNIAYTAAQRGDVATATHHMDQMMAHADHSGTPLTAVQLETVARVHILAGRFAEAVDVLSAVRGDCAGPLPAMDTTKYTESHALPLCLLTLAEAHRGLGDLDTAQALLGRAAELAQQRNLQLVRANIRQEQARVFAAHGDFRSAYAEYTAFHDQLLALQSEEQQARSRVVQATFQAAKSRQDAERFRDLAMRDALTGLYNRRFLDELLASEVARAAQTRLPLSAAIIDADFFKRINDELSHEVGDSVLRTLGGVLVSVRPRGDTVCRLGGEEFVVVMPETPAEEAFWRCEALRQAVADFDWAPMTKAVPVSVSIGVSTADSGQTSPSALLSDADRNLYAAKRSGRNRVMGDVR